MYIALTGLGEGSQSISQTVHLYPVTSGVLGFNCGKPTAMSCIFREGILGTLVYHLYCHSTYDLPSHGPYGVRCCTNTQQRDCLSQRACVFFPSVTWVMMLCLWSWELIETGFNWTATALENWWEVNSLNRHVEHITVCVKYRLGAPCASLCRLIHSVSLPCIPGVTFQCKATSFFFKSKH